jgi:acetoin utilization protein AcuB
MGRTGAKDGPLGGRVRQIMLRNFVSADPEMTAYEAERMMRSARIRHLPVVSDGALVGVLSYRDLLQFALDHLGREPRGLEALRERTIESLMSRDPITAGSGTSLREAALRMLRHRVGCLPIVEGRGPADARVVGLLTESDLIRAALRPPRK